MDKLNKSSISRILAPIILFGASFSPILGVFNEKNLSIDPQDPVVQRRMNVLVGHMNPQKQLFAKKTAGITTQSAFVSDSLRSFKSSRYGVGVLPYFEKNGKKYVLLGREVNSKTNQWKEFSGGAELEPGQKTYEHPTQAAAREFYEEIIGHKTLGWTQKDIESFIDPQRKKLHTTEVIARYGCVDHTGHDSANRITYVTSFDEDAFNLIFAQFGKAYTDVSLSQEFKEKDALIALSYDDLIAQIKQGEEIIDLSKVEVAVNTTGTEMAWSVDSVGKAIGRQLVLDPILYRTLRARYATQDEFAIGSELYHYKRNNNLSSDNYHLYGVQPYVSYQIVEEGFAKLLLDWNHSHQIKNYQMSVLWGLVADLDLKKILKINLEVWEQLIERYHTCKQSNVAMHSTDFVNAVVKQIDLNDFTPAAIAKLHPHILRNLIASNKGSAQLLVRCIAPESLKYFDGIALEELVENCPGLKKEYKSWIEQVGVCGVPHFVVEAVYSSSQENRKYIRELVKKSIDWNAKKDILDYFLINPIYGMRWLNNLGMLKNDKDFIDGLGKWVQKNSGPLEKLTTQSSQHFFMNSGLISYHFAYRLMQAPGLRFQLMNVLKQAKIEEAQGRYVMFHAQKSSFYFSGTMFKKLWEIYYNKPVDNDYYFLRYMQAGDNMNFVKGSETLYAEDWPFYRETLYMNDAPFGSANVSGSDTMHFLLSNHDFSKVTFGPEKLFNVFSWGAYCQKYKSELENIEKLFNESRGSNGSLVLLSFTPEQMRSSVRLAKCGGNGSHSWINDGISEIKTTDVVHLLDALKKNPYAISIVNENGQKEQSSNKTEFYTVLTDGKKDKLLEKDGDGMLNPYNKGIRTYAFPSGDFTNYHKELDKLFVKIAADITQDKKQILDTSSDSSVRSNTLKELAKDIKLTSDDKLNYYYQDCRNLAKLNDRIGKHDQSKTLRVATYNLHFWKDARMGKFKQDDGDCYRIFNTDEMVANIQVINPDVICLQEVQWSYGFRDTLVNKFRKLGYNYGGIDTMTCCNYHELKKGVPTGKKHRGQCFGNLMLSKYPLNDVARGVYAQPAVNYTTGGRGFVAATVTFNKTPIRIYCTHLDVYDETGKTRKLEIEELVQRIDTDDKNYKNIFITGDFNAVRKRDYQYKINGKLAWDLIVQDDAERKVTTPTCVEDTFEKAGYTDAYDLTGKLPPFTCGYGKIVDYGYFKDPKNMTMVCKDVNPYFDRASDHTPIVFDMELK